MSPGQRGARLEQELKEERTGRPRGARLEQELKEEQEGGARAAEEAQQRQAHLVDALNAIREEMDEASRSSLEAQDAVQEAQRAMSADAAQEAQRAMSAVAKVQVELVPAVEVEVVRAVEERDWHSADAAEARRLADSSADEHVRKVAALRAAHGTGVAALHGRILTLEAEQQIEAYPGNPLHARILALEAEQQALEAEQQRAWMRALHARILALEAEQQRSLTALSVLSYRPSTTLTAPPV
ncbi:hypothetical protein T484DRAFT_1764058 [Baffinella frigidus]|nr:hypothetical protein T484DRAFT_1764058 [Cryptophyta sp. CCMP2293]